MIIIWESKLDDELALFVYVIFLLYIHLGWIMKKEELW